MQLVYVSPLKALSYDVERNLRAPLAGVGADVSVGLRTGDTPQKDRQAMLRKPPDILITTPESLYLMLTSRAREILTDVEALIVDEIHAVAPTKRGAHMALTLERLERHVAVEANEGAGRERAAAADRPLGDPAPARADRAVPRRPAPRVRDRRRRRPQGDGPRDRRPGRGHGGPGLEAPAPHGAPVGADGELELPGPPVDPAQMPGDSPTRARSGRRSTPSCSKLVREHTSTIIFVNNRRGAERLAKRLNEMNAEELFEAELPASGARRSSRRDAARPPSEPPVPLDRYPEIARAHHGSLAREERQVVEELLKSGQLPCLVATSSLELGIDMGAVDLVIQVESPKSVARGIQRIGRAGHELGAVSKGRIFPKFRSDLLECAVVAKRMRSARSRRR